MTSSGNGSVTKMNVLYFFLFVLIFFSLYFGMHYYVYHRLAQGLMLSETVRLYLKIFLLAAALSFIAGEFLSRWFAFYLLTYFGSVWLGVIAITFCVFVLKDMAGLIFPQQVKILTISAFGLVLLISGFSLYKGLRLPEVKEIKIRVSKLPPELSGFSIVQLSDLHLGPLRPPGWLEQIVNRTNELAPDLIVITGDLLDNDLGRGNEFCEVLQQLKSRYGVWAITGNHEYYSGLERFQQICRASGITMLMNEGTTIAGAIELVGINDNTARRFSEAGSDLKSVLKNGDSARPIILLSHQPDVFDEAVDSGIDLQLSGHTHAGQVPPMDLIVRLYFRYSCGFYQKNHSCLYTTSGTGTWGPPMRLFSSSEIVKVILQREDD